MFQSSTIAASGKPEFYRELLAQLDALLHGERDPIANAANVSALVFQHVADLNWAGFYFLRGGELVLGPFQGRPACVRIAVGKGVCGTAVAQGRSIIVEDVEAFPGHIACDSASRSELVVPLIRDRTIIGVLDLDSPTKGRFDEDDRLGMERIAESYLRSSDS